MNFTIDSTSDHEDEVKRRNAEQAGQRRQKRQPNHDEIEPTPMPTSIEFTDMGATHKKIDGVDGYYGPDIPVSEAPQPTGGVEAELWQKARTIIDRYNMTAPTDGVEPLWDMSDATEAILHLIAVEATKARVEELERLLARAADFVNEERFYQFGSRIRERLSQLRGEGGQDE